MIHTQYSGCCSRSVHNIRIEQLWVDVTLGFGGKWKIFFHDLEAYDNLDPGNNAHIWLLHHLFLHEINKDIEDWLGSWNNHTMSIQGQRSRTPHDMFFFGMIKEGLGGIEYANDDLSEDELAGYGIDWQDLADHHIRRHHNTANQPEITNHLDDTLADNPFEPQVSENFSNVEVVGPVSLLTEEQIQFLDAGLTAQGLWEGRNFHSYDNKL